MVAEERRVIVPEGPEADRRQSLFDRYYSVGRLRNLAEKAIESSTFGDLWIGLQQTFALFEDGDSNPLGIPPLNGDLFSAIAVKDLQGTHLYNNVLLACHGTALFVRRPSCASAGELQCVGCRGTGLSLRELAGFPASLY